MNVEAVSLYLITQVKSICYQSIMAYAFWQLFHKKDVFKGFLSFHFSFVHIQLLLKVQETTEQLVT